ncbi:hypothetical protein SteCoe_28257 [Stentor coeruleus]|uniref:Uncharacterized protein n=1 Tax=Stentor coeruleus TaxID=5963 RepID=A0A1R2B8Q2_9CILI|nr:hypothetical protein SteCoe_28257 [Stentor coeruleus]
MDLLFKGKSPELQIKSRKRQFQPRQKHNRKRNESLDTTHFSEIDMDRSGFYNRISLLQEFPIKSHQEKSLHGHCSVSPKIRRNSRLDHTKRLSPYSVHNSYITVAERVAKPIHKMKQKPKIDLLALQNHFLEFQKKSMFLLKQLEKNVLG